MIFLQDAGGAGCGCPPLVRTCHKCKCGLKWQPARVLQFSAGFAATRMAAASYLGQKCKQTVQPDIRNCQFLYAGCQGKSLLNGLCELRLHLRTHHCMSA